MKILNQKEEVIPVELTFHGRKLLADGILHPYYFSFHDDSIVYDISYVDNNVSYDDSYNRILNNSLTFGLINTKDHLLSRPLGKSKNLSNYSPSWDISLLNGILEYDNESSTYYKKIFTFRNIEYILTMDENNDPIVKDDYILIDLKEFNVDNNLENFEIEIITYDELSGGKEVGLERKLKFNKNKTNIINDILHEEDELPIDFFDVNIDDGDVSYYLDVLTDDEISDDFIITKDKEKQQIIDNLYSSNYAGPVDPKC